MKYELKSIGPWSFTKIIFFFNLIVGFVLGLLMAAYLAFLMAMAPMIPGFDAGELGLEGSSITLIFITLPILGALGGAFFYTIAGVILVWLYNLLARMVGGLELTLNVESKPIPAPIPVGRPHESMSTLGRVPPPTVTAPPPTPVARPSVPPHNETLSGPSEAKGNNPNEDGPVAPTDQRGDGL
ncbi:MAG: DUF3566 domain-containing protein [Candidatus Zixiibacteriota bacterium]